MPIRAAQYLVIAILLLSLCFAPASIGQVGVGVPQNVIWINTTNCTIAGNSLQKTAGRSDSADAGARSQQIVTSGDALFEFAAGDSNKVLFCGLTHAAIGTGFSEIDFAIKLTELGFAEIRENNAYGGETSYRIGDVFRIAVQANVVRYYKNGGLFHTSSKAPSYPLFAAASFLTVGGRIDNPVIGALAVSTSAEWTSYQHDSAHSAYSESSAVGAANAGNLTQSWSFPTGDWVTGTPVVSGGVVYVGSWDGNMYALRESDGAVLWSYNAGTIRIDPCSDTYGIDGTAALSGGKLYFGTGQAQLHAVNAANGQAIWRTQLADPTQAFHIYGSPLVFDGKIYIGLASHCVNPCITGRLVCVDASDGRVLWNFATAPDGSKGGAVWSSATVDPGRRMIYVGTGNFCTGADTHSSAVIALNADTGALVWEFKKLRADLNNLDFGASPVLFDIDGRQMLAIPSKDGHCYGLHRATGELIWDTVVTDGDSRGGSISSPATAYGKIFFGATVRVATGKVVALDQRDGRIVWDTPLSLPVIGAAAVAGGAVFVGGADGRLRAFDASTGSEVWNSPEHNQMLGGVSISAASLFIGSTDNSVYAFSLPNVGPQPPASASIAVNSPSAGEQWTPGEKYRISWSARAAVSKVDVSISRDGGSTWQVLAEDVDSSLGTLRVKAKKPRSETVLVRLTDSSNDSVFGQSGMFYIR
ncbi:MAG: PQQ-binding-like beta-propeller repeat protein [Acidobacteriota bacterium]